MKKILLTAVLILATASTCFAMSQRREYPVTPDVLINPTAEPFKGGVVILNGPTIKLNRDHVTEITAFSYANTPDSVTVMYDLGGATLADKPQVLPLEFQGKIGWASWNTYFNQHKVWKPTTASTMSGPALFEQNGITINPAYFKAKLSKIGEGENPASSMVSQKNVNGTMFAYPEWSVRFKSTMSRAVYEAQFKPAVQASVFAPIFRELPPTVSDGTR